MCDKCACAVVLVGMCVCGKGKYVVVLVGVCVVSVVCD